MSALACVCVRALSLPVRACVLSLFLFVCVFVCLCVCVCVCVFFACGDFGGRFDISSLNSICNLDHLSCANPTS